MDQINAESTSTMWDDTAIPLPRGDQELKIAINEVLIDENEPTTLKRLRSNLVEENENKKPSKIADCCKKFFLGIDRVFGCCPEATKQQREKRWWSGDVYKPLHFSIMFVSGGLISMLLYACMTSFTVVEVQSVEYDKLEGCARIAGANYSDPSVYPGRCTFELNVTQDMNPPIYFYYELNNFWQNNMEYRDAYSIDQLLGVSANSTGLCLDIKTYNGLNIYPCGNIAYSFFADRFEMTDLTEDYDFCSNCASPGVSESWADVWANWSSEPDWSSSNIAWKTDRENIFLGVAGDVSGVSREGWRQAEIYDIPLPDITDEDLMVWMRVATLPNFIKPFRIIRNRSLSAGTRLQVTAHAFFDIGYPGSYKKVRLRSTNTRSAWGFAKQMGSESMILKWMYLSAGFYLLVFGLLVLCCELAEKFKRKMGVAE